MNTEPDYRTGDDASTNDARVTAWGLADVAFELRTANLLAFYNQIDKPHGRASQELHELIVQRLGLRDEAEQATDPVKDKAREIFNEAGRGNSEIEFDEIAPDHRGEYLRIARHVLGQETNDGR